MESKRESLLELSGPFPGIKAISLRPDHLPVVTPDNIAPYTVSSPPVMVEGTKLLVRQEPTYDIIEQRDQRGALVARHVLRGPPSSQRSEHFAKAIQRWREVQDADGMDGILRITDCDMQGGWFETAACSVGTATDLPALQWPIQRVLNFVEQVCWTLASIHTAGAVHGSLTPSKIWLGEDLSPSIEGLGVIDVYQDLDGDEDGRFGYGPYAAPEARRGQVSVASDIYSVGQVMYYALHGQHPEVKGPPLRTLAELDYVPAGLVRIIRRCTASDPRQRYASVFELMADLRRYGRFCQVGLAHPDHEDPNRTGLLRRTPGSGGASRHKGLSWLLRKSYCPASPGTLRRRRLWGALVLTLVTGTFVVWLVNNFAEQGPEQHAQSTVSPGAQVR